MENCVLSKYRVVFNMMTNCVLSKYQMWVLWWWWWWWWLVILPILNYLCSLCFYFSLRLFVFWYSIGFSVTDRYVDRCLWGQKREYCNDRYIHYSSSHCFKLCQTVVCSTIGSCQSTVTSYDCTAALLVAASPL